MSGQGSNPYQAQSIDSAAAAAVQALQSSRALAAEIRREDVTMAADLAVLAPRSRLLTHGASSGADKKGGTLSVAPSTLVRENMTTEAYIDKTRDIGLVRMSLADKKSEIRKLEEDIDRAEKRLRQRQEQLESTREKFNSFLKYSNLEQDAAVRRADGETKAKLEKVVEIKKLTARMNHVELDIHNADHQLESCLAYKRFLDNLTKPRWFSDVLTGLRVADSTEQILLDTEGKYERMAADLERDHAAAVEARAGAEAKLEHRQAQRQAEAAVARRGKSSSAPAAAAAAAVGMYGEEDRLPDLVPLEDQLAELEARLGAEAQRRTDEETAQIMREVEAMTLEEVKERLEGDYDEDRIPMHFKNVDELLEVFINVEEGNLFLIQNCQELEEELEGVAMANMTERSDTQAMTSQRHAQMAVLAEKIAAAQGKLQQLEDRTAALDRRVPGAAASTDGSSSATGAAGGAPAPVAMTPEMYRELVERSIASMFRTLNAGELAIKQLGAQQQRLTQRQAEAAAGASAIDAGPPPPADDEAGPFCPGSTLSGAMTKKKSTAALGATATGKQQRIGTLTGSRGKGKTAGAASADATATSGGNGGGGGGGDAPANSGGDAGANMGAVELLTIIENKLQEYYRTITDPATAVDDGLILSVMKASDKERRRQARIEHMARQAAEHEERNNRMLERSQAPVVRRVGKPVLRRSHAPPDDSAGRSGSPKGRRSKKSLGGYDDDDGAEFFT